MRTCTPALPLVLLALALPAQEGAPGERKLATIPGDLELTASYPGPAGDKVPVFTRFCFGAGGRFVAYAGFRGDKVVAMVGDGELGEFDFLHQPVMDHTASHYAFRAGNRVEPDKETWWAIVDGERGPEHDWIGEVAVGSTGLAAFWEQPGARVEASGAYTESPMVLRIGKSKSRRYQQGLSLVRPTFSADGKVVATAVLRDRQWRALVATERREKIARDGHPTVEDAVISPDGRKVALVVIEGITPLPHVALGGKLLGQGTDASCVPVFSPDGRRLAFKFLQGERMGLARDDDKELRAKWDYVGTPVFDQKGQRLAFATNQGGKVAASARLQPRGDNMVLSGTWTVWVREGKDAPQAIVEGIGGAARFAFGPRGELAYAQRARGRWYVMVGDRRSEGFDDVGELHWSADGKQVEFGARRDRELLWYVLPLE